MIKLGVLVSGNGSNLQAIIDAIEAGKLDAQIVTVISNKADAYGLERARDAGIRAVHIDPTIPGTDPAVPSFTYNSAIRDELLSQGAEYVVMAGYMKLLGSEVLEAYPMKVLNLHPALLPSFPGAHGIEDALEHGAKVTGITVHFADEDFDRGPIIAQRAVEVLEGDTPETLAERIHAAEHELYPLTLQWIADDRVTVEGRRVRIQDQ
ncbi:MAG: phosphoribosylglycinamide formyltransferase [Coriobacteriia bacterium]|nr:phosphoribosylglycinamide formyltransferase [Coriobacteriia bacterium]